MLMGLARETRRARLSFTISDGHRRCDAFRECTCGMTIMPVEPACQMMGTCSSNPLPPNRATCNSNSLSVDFDADFCVHSE